MEFLIRPVKAGDGEGINELRRMPGVFENILGIPSERIKRNEDFVQNMGANTHQFVAVIERGGAELIIGCAGLTVPDTHRKRHTGGIGIMVHKDYQGDGVGYGLMETLLDVADNWLMLVRVELTVFIDNERAIGLYKKLGFEVEGTLKKAGIRAGEYVDEFIMARIRHV